MVTPLSLQQRDGLLAAVGIHAHGGPAVGPRRREVYDLRSCVETAEEIRTPAERKKFLGLAFLLFTTRNTTFNEQKESLKRKGMFIRIPVSIDRMGKKAGRAVLSMIARQGQLFAFLSR